LPHASVQERTAEPWILHDFGRDFYNEQLRLVVAAYIRPEADFTSLDALIARIHADADVARAALDKMPLASLAMDPFLQPSATEAVHTVQPSQTEAVDEVQPSQTEVANIEESVARLRT